MTRTEVEKITNVVVLSYGHCTPGVGSTFVRMLLLIDALLGPTQDDAAFDICSRVFQREHAAFERDFAGVFSPHGDRWQLRFDDDAAQWN